MPVCSTSEDMRLGLVCMSAITHFLLVIVIARGSYLITIPLVL